jgi:hypothetical protein
VFEGDGVEASYLENHDRDGVVDGGDNDVVCDDGVRDRRTPGRWRGRRRRRRRWRRLRDLGLRIERWLREGSEDDGGDDVDWRTTTTSIGG